MPCFGWTSGLSVLAVGALLLAPGCQREQAPPPQTWDHCLAETDLGKPLERLEGFLERPGTVAFGDAGCDWMTVATDAGVRTVTRHKVFGTLLRYDAARGATISTPDVRVVSHRRDSLRESFEWKDRDGDGRHELEKRVAFGPEGEELSGEELLWGAAGQPLERNSFTVISANKRHLVTQRFADGGWVTISENDTVDRCVYQPIVPIRTPGK